MKRKVIFTAAKGKTYTKVFTGFVGRQHDFMHILECSGFICVETEDAYIYTK